jgi:hypothetical protein
MDIGWSLLYIFQYAAKPKGLCSPPPLAYCGNTNHCRHWRNDIQPTKAKHSRTKPAH